MQPAVRCWSLPLQDNRFFVASAVNLSLSWVHEAWAGPFFRKRALFLAIIGLSIGRPSAPAQNFGKARLRLTLCETLDLARTLLQLIDRLGGNRVPSADQPDPRFYSIRRHISHSSTLARPLVRGFFEKPQSARPP